VLLLRPILAAEAVDPRLSVNRFKGKGALEILHARRDPLLVLRTQLQHLALGAAAELGVRIDAFPKLDAR
jgi:hypothetical protein